MYCTYFPNERLPAKIINILCIYFINFSVNHVYSALSFHKVQINFVEIMKCPFILRFPVKHGPFTLSIT